MESERFVKHNRTKWLCSVEKFVSSSFIDYFVEMRLLKSLSYRDETKCSENCMNMYLTINIIGHSTIEKKTIDWIFSSRRHATLNMTLLLESYLYRYGNKHTHIYISFQIVLNIYHEKHDHDKRRYICRLQQGILKHICHNKPINNVEDYTLFGTAANKIDM